MKNLTHLFLSSILILFIHQSTFAQCEASISFQAIGNGAYSVTNESTLNGTLTNAQIAFFTQSSGWAASWQSLTPGQSMVINNLTFTPENISVSIDEYPSCRDSLIYDIVGNIVFDYNNCMLDVLVTTAADGHVSITNNSISNGAGIDATVYFTPSQNTNISTDVLILSGQTISHEMPGNDSYNYDVYLDGVSCHSSNQSVIITNANSCGANFNHNVSNTSNFAVNFTSISNQNTSNTSYAWDFGDNSTSTDQNPVHTFATGPTADYNVCLTTTNISGTGCAETICQIISVTNPDICNAQFSYQQAVNSITADFQAISYNPSLTYSLDFGDGSTASTPFISHTYTADGTYQACLTVSNPFGNCVQSSCQTITVLTPCNAQFTRTLVNGLFTGTPVISTALLNYLWDFGDGTTSTLMNATHQYTFNGYYQVSLTVSNTNGCSDSYAITNHINDQTECLTEAFIYQSYDVNDPLTIHVSAINPTPGAIYTWTFGNTTIVGGPQETFTFPTSGSYFVNLSVNDPAAGCVNNNFIYVDVWASGIPATYCDANFYLFEDATNPASLYAYNLSTGNNLNYQWSFGDGEFSTDAYPTHVYDAVGIYNLCLIVSSANCSDTLCEAIEIITKSQGVTLNILNPSSMLSTTELSSASAWDLNLFPNPADETTKIIWTESSNSVMEIRLLDVSGKQISTKTVQSVSGKNTHIIELSAVVRGMYLLEISNQQTGKKEVRQLIKK